MMNSHPDHVYIEDEGIAYAYPMSVLLTGNTGETKVLLVVN
jgi:hypothetical protein